MIIKLAFLYQSKTTVWTQLRNFFFFLNKLLCLGKDLLAN